MRFKFNLAISKQFLLTEVNLWYISLLEVKNLVNTVVQSVLFNINAFLFVD